MYEAIREVIRDKIVSFLRRYCRCIEIEEKYRDILNLAGKLDKIEEAIKRRISLDLGDIRVTVSKGLFKSRICIHYKGVSYCNDDVSLFLSRARTIISYYNSDCDINNIISDTILTNDFNLIDFVKRNLAALRRLCTGESSNLDMTMLENYVKDAVRNAVEEYLSTIREMSSHCEEDCH